MEHLSGDSVEGRLFSWELKHGDYPGIFKFYFYIMLFGFSEGI